MIARCCADKINYEKGNIMTSEFNVEHTIGDIAPQAIVEEEQRQLARKFDYDTGDERRLQRIKLLEKYKDRYPTQELADRLGSCRRGNRCMSAACPACSGHFLCWYLRARNIFAPHVLVEGVVGLSVMLPGTAKITKEGRISGLEYQRKMTEIFARSAVEFAAGVVAYYALTAPDNDQVYLFPHFKMAAVTRRRSRLRRALKVATIPVENGELQMFGVGPDGEPRNLDAEEQESHECLESLFWDKSGFDQMVLLYGVAPVQTQQGLTLTLVHGHHPKQMQYFQ
jgi:hypothetical protein